MPFLQKKRDTQVSRFLFIILAFKMVVNSHKGCNRLFGGI